LIGELVAAVHATSHIEKLAAARTYNTSRQTGLSVMVGEPPAGVVDYDAVVAGSQTRCPSRLRWLG